ncbi:MAG: hypothetical protein AB9866_18930 [Syntrophobacteraceae bacterium]
MVPNELFLKQPKSFWAYIRSISENYGYTVRGQNSIKVPNALAVRNSLESLGLDPTPLFSGRETTALGKVILDYFSYRAKVLNTFVEQHLMDVDDARELFESLHKRLCPKCHLPMNKQKNEKKAPAYFTGIINMLIESNLNGISCNYNPRQLTTVTKNRLAVRTLARWVDGAFPQVINPIAVWEIKEYYYTTTFGSRVADGVYESLLDGMELEELHEHEGINVQHLLMIDSHNTWWKDGKSYLCRMIDMLHMGYVDEIIFGKEAVDRMPIIVRGWVAEHKRRTA